jgi:hypothetical protein
VHNVICLKHGTKFDADYVNKLYAGVKRNTTVDFLFHCFTDDPTGIDDNIIIHPLPYDNVEGWWQKLYLFSDEIDIKGRVLFLDLDTLITGNIDGFITQDKGFVVLRDLWAGGINVGSAVLSFEVGKYKHIWNTFIRNPAAAIGSLHPHGDQKWIQKQQAQRTYWQDLFPNQIMSFKSNCRNGLPSTATIVCFHGKPSIPEAINTTTHVQRFVIPPTPWVAEYWRND